MLSSSKLSLLVSAVLPGAALFLGCVSVTLSGPDGGNGSGVGGFSGAGGSAAASGSTGDGGGALGAPYSTYAYLCGGSAAKCTPGTSDCTPGGNPNLSSGTGMSMLACQLVSTDSKVAAVCNLVGDYIANDPCESAAHCGAGLGCVTNNSGGVCRQYCCGNVELCPADTYCAPVPMMEAAEDIPVCTPVKKCKLLDDSICVSGQVCTIVRDNGTTSCVDAGTGKINQNCPCADGYVCSKITSTCLKLCHINNDAVDCPGGACQGGVAGYPTGIGICVGSQ